MRSVTLAEYFATGDRPVEIIDGELLFPNPNHSRRKSGVVANVLRKLANDEASAIGEGYAYAPYILKGDPASKQITHLRLPDVSYMMRERIKAHDAQYPDQDEPWWLAPDLAVEVISPTDLYSEVSQKVAGYIQFGVRLIWVIDPAAKSVRVHSPGELLGHSLSEASTLSAEPVIEGWSIKVSELFGDD